MTLLVSATGAMPRSTVPGIVAGVALLAAAGWFFFWRDSDERRIQGTVSEIQRLVARSPAESDLAALASARKIALYFTDPFSVVAEPVGFRTRDRRSLIGAIHQYRSRSRTLYMRVYDEDLRLDASRQRATLDLVAEFVNDLGDVAGAERYPMTIHWLKTDDDWRIESVELSAAFQPAGDSRHR